MLRYRLISATGLLILVGACVTLDYQQLLGLRGGTWLLPLLFAASAGTALEMARMLKAGNNPVHVPVAVAGALITTMMACLPVIWESLGATYPPNCPVGRLGWLTVGALLGVGLAVLAEMRAFHADSQHTTARIATAALITVYVGVPLALLVAIRDLGSDPNWGIAALLTLIATTKASDAGAYFAGKSLGRNKLIPRLSPGKTWEGAIGGLLASTAVAYVCCHVLFAQISEAATPPPWWGPLALGVACALAGMFGDLAESLFKRDSGVKDSGGLLPGLGGVWDVTDSLIGAALPGFLCFAAGAAGNIP